MKLSEELRNKKSRDNRALLDRAADRIDELEKGYRKQIEGEWEWFEEWNPSTPEHPRECDDCGWRCGECKTALADIVGGYWDDPDKKPKLNFCPNCGAKMKGGK